MQPWMVVLVVLTAVILVTTAVRSRGPVQFVRGVALVALLGFGYLQAVQVPEEPGVRTTRGLAAFTALAPDDTTTGAWSGRVTSTALAEDAVVEEAMLVDWPGGTAAGTAPVSLRVPPEDVLGGGLVIGDLVDVDVGDQRWAGLVVGVMELDTSADEVGGPASHVLTLMVEAGERVALRRAAQANQVVVVRRHGG